MHLADRFQAPILCILSIMIGLPLGWWLRDNQNKFELLSVAPNNKAEPLSDHTIAISTNEPYFAEIKTTHQKIRTEFIQALDSGQLDDALIIFQHHEKFHSAMATELHHELINKVCHYHHNNNPENEKTIVPLSGSGGHFVVDTLAGNQHNVRLLIDTGASLTTLPHRILAELQQRKQARKIGYIDLTTATGIHRTPLYRLDQFQIGDFLVSNMEAAEFGPVDQNIDGLLGMNILNHFNFSIDQNLRQLSLMPRQME